MWWVDKNYRNEVKQSFTMLQWSADVQWGMLSCWVQEGQLIIRVHPARDCHIARLCTEFANCRGKSSLPSRLLSSAQVRDNIEMHFWNNEVACSGADLRTRAGNKPSRSLCFTITEKPLTHGNHEELVCLASTSKFHFYLTCFNAQLA